MQPKKQETGMRAATARTGSVVCRVMVVWAISISLQGAASDMQPMLEGLSRVGHLPGLLLPHNKAVALQMYHGIGPAYNASFCRRTDESAGDSSAGGAQRSPSHKVIETSVSDAMT